MKMKSDDDEGKIPKINLLKIVVKQGNLNHESHYRARSAAFFLMRVSGGGEASTVQSTCCRIVLNKGFEF